MWLLAKIKSYLLQNTSSKQIVLKNTFWLILAEFVSKWSIAIITILIGRMFGKEIFGMYSYRWVILAFLLIFADLGLTTLLIRDYQHLDNAHKKHYLSQGLKTKGILSTVVSIAFLLILFFVTDDIMIRSIWLLLLCNGLANSFLEYLRGTFRSLQRSEVEFKIKLTQWIGNLVLIPLIFVVWSIVPIIAVQAFVVVITIGYAWKIIHTKQEVFDKEVDGYRINKIELVKNGWAFAMSGLFISMYYYIDSVIIQWYRGYEAVWVYNAAYRILVIAIIPLGIFINSAFPTLRSLYTERKEKFFADIKKYFIFIALLTVIAIPIWIFLSQWLLTFLYGSSYADWIIILQVLLLSLAILYLNAIFAISLQATWNERRYTYSTFIALWCNVVLNIIFIPRYWGIAAAWATVATELLVSCLMSWYFYFRIYRPYVQSKK